MCQCIVIKYNLKKEQRVIRSFIIISLLLRVDEEGKSIFHHLPFSLRAIICQASMLCDGQSKEHRAGSIVQDRVARMDCNLLTHSLTD